MQRENIPQPPRVRSERVGPSESGPSASIPRSARLKGRVLGGKISKQGIARLFTWKWLLLVAFTSLLFIVGGCSAIALSGKMYPLEDIEKNNMPLASSIVDEKWKPITQFGGEQREYITIEQLRKHNSLLVSAFEKVEDRRFRDHIGVDFYSLGRALVANITDPGSEGGSTLTMQVCKNIVLANSEKTLTRKIQEFGCALNLEKKYTKDQILEAYLNYIGFGGDIAGVQMASKVYFGVDLKTQTLPTEKVAVLAGMPKAPSTYQPVRHPKNAMKRRNVVLLEILCKDNDTPALITQAEAEKLAKKPLGTIPEKEGSKYTHKQKYDAYKALVKEEIKQRYPDINVDDLDKLGLKIRTGLNPTAQDAVEDALKKDELFVNNNGQKLTGADAGITMIDPKTGLITAVGGGRDYKTGSKIRALEKVQPGSSIKPLTVYTPAIQDHGYDENKMVNDEPITIEDSSGNPWTPKNYSGKANGRVRMVEMVKHSYNLSTVRLLKDEVGLDAAFNYGKRLGLSLEDADRGYAPLALGGLSHGVPTVEMAQAYSVFPNNGWYKPAHTIIEIKDDSGKLIPPKDQGDMNKQKRVFNAQSTYYMTRMLQEVIKSGSGKKAQLQDGRPVAGKTGTNNDGASAWFVGYTPDLVMAVDVFYPLGGKKIEVTGSSAPAKIFSYVMSETLKNKPKLPFKKPSGVKEPESPFELEKPKLEAKYNDKQKAVFLSWQKQSNQVRYEIFRSEDKQNWQKIDDAPPGSMGYQDISVGGLGGFLDQIFGGGSKTYFYQVVAIDTQEPDPQKGSISSNIEKVEIKPDKGNDKGGGDKKKGDHPLDRNGNGRNDLHEDLNRNGMRDGREDLNGDGIPDGQQDLINPNGIPDGMERIN